MNKACKKYITIAGIVLIYTLYMPVAFVSQAKNIQEQNETVIPMRTIYLNNTVLRELDNNEHLNNKDRFICLYSYIQQVINEKIKSYALNTTNISLYNTFVNEDYQKSMLSKVLINNKVEIIDIKRNQPMSSDWTYVVYKTILNKMNNKYI
jgi:hypothetical protein